MKSNRTNLKAFTLSEMVVVLVLTAIVAGLAFSVLGLVQKHMKAISINYKNNTSFHMLEQGLWVDFHKSESIYYNGETRELYCDSLVYYFAPPLLVRQQDTIDLGIKEVVLFFNGSPISSYTNNIQVDAIKVTMDSISGNKKLFVFKNNSASNFMN